MSSEEEDVSDEYYSDEESDDVEYSDSSLEESDEEGETEHDYMVKEALKESERQEKMGGALTQILGTVIALAGRATGLMGGKKKRHKPVTSKLARTEDVFDEALKDDGTVSDEEDDFEEDRLSNQSGIVAEYLNRGLRVVRDFKPLNDWLYWNLRKVLTEPFVTHYHDVYRRMVDQGGRYPIPVAEPVDAIRQSLILSSETDWARLYRGFHPLMLVVPQQMIQSQVVFILRSVWNFAVGYHPRLTLTKDDYCDSFSGCFTHATAAAITAVIWHPFDYVRTYMMADVDGEYFPTYADCARTMWRAHGPEGFMVGAAESAIQAFCGTVMSAIVYEAVCEYPRYFSFRNLFWAHVPNVFNDVSYEMHMLMIDRWKGVRRLPFTGQATLCHIIGHAIVAPLKAIKEQVQLRNAPPALQYYY